jgi:ATP-dependent DNA helicase RecG
LKTPLEYLWKYKFSGLSKAAALKLSTLISLHRYQKPDYPTTVFDLLKYYPWRYEDRRSTAAVSELRDGEEVSLDLIVRVSGGYQVKRKQSGSPPLYIFEISAVDPRKTTEPVLVYWFLSGKSAEKIILSQSKKFSRGVRFSVFGHCEWDSRRGIYKVRPTKPNEIEIITQSESDKIPAQIIDIAQQNEKPTNQDNGLATSIKALSGSSTGKPDRKDEKDILLHSDRIVPVYKKLGTFNSKRLREIIFTVLENLEPGVIKDPIPASIRVKYGLINRLDAFKEIHFPGSAVSIEDISEYRTPAAKRLVFEEFFLMSYAMRYRRHQRRRLQRPYKIEISQPVKARIKSLLPFSLTSAQRKAVKDIFSDLNSPHPMNRLLQGDVGSGKTIVAFVTAFVVMENGYQAAFMAPTEILAEQHHKTAVKLFSSTGYKVALLTGSQSASEKKRLHHAIRKGEIDLVIGTHALIQSNVRFDSLALVIIDEQHRFGVLQRSRLISQDKTPDVLHISATPIPRTLAMTVYGDLDISVIDQLPPGRIQIKTVVVSETERAGVYKGIEREISKGRQVYIVYPVIEESEALDLRAAAKMYDELRFTAFPNRRLALLHGKMKPEEKEKIMARWAAGEIDILVSTTVVEVGVDNPNASLMIIEHAERFGLSQLHQLRGRIGRGPYQSFCVLMTNSKKNSDAMKRLKILEKTSDGFKIAEADLEIRGEGEIFGTRQSGYRIFDLANIFRDREILEDAQTAVEMIEKGQITADEKSLLERLIAKNFRFKLADIA